MICILIENYNMAKKVDRKLLVGLDIGTTKVVVLIGEVMPDGQVD